MIKIMTDRKIAIDTELTATNIDGGDRIIQIGIVEIFNNKTIGQSYSWYCDPEGRNSSPDALRIHKISDKFLTSQPTFKQQQQEIRDVIGNSLIVHHCWLMENHEPMSVDEYAMFNEFKRSGITPLPHAQWINTKMWAHQELNGDIPYTNQGSSLDLVIRKYDIDTGSRDDKHDACEDARIHADAYIAMAPTYMFSS